MIFTTEHNLKCFTLIEEMHFLTGWNLKLCFIGLVVTFQLQVSVFVILY